MHSNYKAIQKATSGQYLWWGKEIWETLANIIKTQPAMEINSEIPIACITTSIILITET